MEPTIIIVIITTIATLVISIFKLIKRSRCCNCIDIETRQNILNNPDVR